MMNWIIVGFEETLNGQPGFLTQSSFYEFFPLGNQVFEAKVAVTRFYWQLTKKISLLSKLNLSTGY